MDFNTTFKVVTNSVIVAHPGGAEFHLLPFAHMDAWHALGRKMNLRALSKLESYFKAIGVARDKGDAEPKLLEFYETGDELLDAMNHLTAAHITGWSDLTSDGAPLVYSFATALKLVSENPSFGGWIDAESKKLADAEAAAEEVISDTKKN